MYTLLLMTAMSTAPDAPEFGGLFSNLFHGGGCSGSCSGSGSGYGSCYSQSAGCYGSCHGGGFGSRLRAFFHRGSSCYGSCTGRSSGGYGSCTGRSYSCCGGGYTYAAPLSCTGGLPGGYDVPPPGLGEYAVPSPAVSFAGPSGVGYACGYTLGLPTPVGDPYPAGPFPPTMTPPPTIPPVGPAVPTPAPPPDSVSEDPLKRRGYTPAPGLPAGGATGRATVVVRLPADAKLYAEGRLLSLTSAERTFVTPVLPAGREYTYAFRAEYVRDGETISQTKRVPVVVGGTVTLEFADLTAARDKPAPTDLAAKPAPLPVAAVPTGLGPKPIEPVKPPTNPFVGGPAPAAASAPERARITVKLPPGATLYVDGKKNERTESVREFATPPLPPGQEFAYRMRVEVAGQQGYQDTKVTFRAGELVTVDFTAAPTK